MDSKQSGGAMLNLTEMRENANRFIRFVQDGQDQFAARLVMARLVHPLLQLLDAMESNRGERWRTLAEAIRETGNTKNWFEKALKSRGDRCRLECWRDEGLAEQTLEGLWMICPIALATARLEEAEEHVEPNSPLTSQPSHDVAGLIKKLA
jgi:hypothetical protein